MSTATDLLSTAKNNGLLLSLEGENLRVRWQGVPPSQDLLASIKTHKQELISLLAINDHYETFVVSEVSTNGENIIHPHIEDRPPTWSMDRYAHMVKCQQCEHLTDDGHCRVKPQYKPMPEAMRDCVSFDVSKTGRIAIANAPYSVSELNDLLNRYEKKLFHHLVDCVACSFMDSRYCVDAFAIGSSYDAMLLVFDDAASKREALLNAVIRARISGRKVFVSLDHDKA